MQPYHYWGEDLQLGATNDLRGVEGVEEGTQALLRRLLTAPGELLFHPEYGAGLPARVGSLLNLPEIEGLVLAQLRLEARVASDPTPKVKLVPKVDSLFVSIQYVDAPTGQSQILEFGLDR